MEKIKLTRTPFGLIAHRNGLEFIWELIKEVIVGVVSMIITMMVRFKNIVRRGLERAELIGRKEEYSPEREEIGRRIEVYNILKRKEKKWKHG